MDMQSRRLIQILKYWLKIVHCGEHRYIKQIYRVLLADANNGKLNWVSQVKHALCTYGMADAWQLQAFVNPQWSILEMTQRIKDRYVQDWHGRLENTSRGECYVRIQPEYSFSSYLDSVYISKHRRAITKLRLSSHHLNIETGRWRRPNPVPRAERRCRTCDVVEDEYHFLFECTLYKESFTQVLPGDII